MLGNDFAVFRDPFFNLLSALRLSIFVRLLFGGEP
jgi:hypothetical protein